MAFDNVTLFEVNLPNDVLGGAAGEKPDDKHAGTDPEDTAEESGGGSKGKLLLAALALAGLGIAIRRFRSDDDDQADVEMAYEEPGVEVEQSDA